MKIDFSQTIPNQRGEALRNPDGSKVTLRQVAVDAINNISGVPREKIKSYWDLSKRIELADGPVDLETHEAADLQSQIEQRFAVQVAYPASQMFEVNGESHGHDAD